MRTYSFNRRIFRFLVLMVLTAWALHAQAQARVELDNLSWFTADSLSPGSYAKPGSTSETIVSNIPAGGGPAVFCTGLGGGNGPNGQTIIAGTTNGGSKGFFQSLNDYGGTYTLTRTYQVTPGKLTYMKVHMATIQQSWLRPSSISASIDGRSLGTADRSNSSYWAGRFLDGSQSWTPTSSLVTLVISITAPGGCHADEEILYIDAFYQAASNINAADDTGATVSSNGGQSLANVLSNDSLNNATPSLATVNLTQISSTNPKVNLNLATGAVIVAPGTPGGTQQVVYQICEKANPSNCSQATVTVPVTLAPPTITIKKALAGGGRINAKDQFTVNLMFYQGSQVASGTTTGSGSTVDANSGTTNPVPAQFDIDYPIYYNMGEVMAPGSVSALSAYTTTVACQNDGGGTTNVSGIRSLTTPFAVNDGDAIVCTITNSSPGAPVLSLKKALLSNRVNDTDQFTVQLKTGNTIASSATTGGTGTGITGGTTGPFTATAGIVYSFAEIPSGTTQLAQYGATLACTNSRTVQQGGTDVSGISSISATITPKAFDVIDCTINNTVPSAKLTIYKTTTLGTGSFTFNGSATNANGFPGNYQITTTAANTPKGGSSVTLTATNKTTEVTETVPPTWVLSSASCVDNNAAVTGNTGSFGKLIGATLQIEDTHVLAGSDLQCTFTNAPGMALSLTQLIIAPFPINLPPPFTFNYTINNGWPVVPQPLTTSKFNVPVSTATTPLTASNVDTTMSTVLPDARWFVSSFVCVDTNAAITNNPTGTLVRVVGTSITIPAANVRPGSALKCTLTMGHKVP
jgi:hypothetical protein